MGELVEVPGLGATQANSGEAASLSHCPSRGEAARGEVMGLYYRRYEGILGGLAKSTEHPSRVEFGIRGPRALGCWI